MNIFREQTKGCRKGPEAWFSGAVWLDDVITSPNFTATRVSFEPGARTAWHTHPLGQALRVEHGICQIQLLGGPVQELGAGDSVWIEPGEVHWHGAAPGRTMVHLAMQASDSSGTSVVWGEHVE
jgi:quercetin dioxygenase-like cupin family protein